MFRMLTGVTATAIVSYTATTALYATDLFGKFDRGVRFGRIAMWLSVLLAAFVGLLTFQAEGTAAFVDTRTVFLVLVLLLSGGYLFVSNQDRSLLMLGAFIAPASALLLSAFLVLQYGSFEINERVTAILVAHIAFATIGLGAFVLASCISSLYLLQERLLRSRSFGRLFHRLPGLEDLDSLSLKLLILGFVVFTISLVLGVVWAVRIGDSGQMLRIYLSGGAWLLFAIMLYMRVRSGWRGTQAAWLTLVGTLSAIGVLGVYVVA
jgi:ABC-type uncharacterized transport system permease subunit